MSESLASASIFTREFWSRFSNPSSASLGKSILSLLVIAETLVSFFWIYTLSGLGEGYALIAAVPYFYLVISYVSLFIFYRFKRYEYFTFTQLVMLLVIRFSCSGPSAALRHPAAWLSGRFYLRSVL